jgi:hypothetical protein
VLVSMMPIAIFLAWVGITTVRAQMFTLLFTAVLLSFLDRDRRGDRRWIAPWLACHLLWLNLHGGFVVGATFIGLHAVEQLLRRQPAAHLALVLAAMAALLPVNPYGLRYVEYLGPALSMDRSSITEWRPVWEAFPPLIALFAISLLLLVYPAARVGLRGMPGLPIVLAAAWAGIQHERHLSIYGVVWLCWVPAWFRDTQLAVVLERIWRERRRPVHRILGLVALASGAVVLYHGPWRLPLPANPGDHPQLTYPVGAVEHLARHGFQGNLLVRFNEGAYVSWKLYPAVRVSMDGRYEVAYPPGALRQNQDFFAARPGWQDHLEDHAADAVLAPAGQEITARLAELPGWSRVYRDDSYEVFLRPGLELPEADRRGEVLRGTFP